MQLGTHVPFGLQTHSFVLPHCWSLAFEGGLLGVQVDELVLESPLELLPEELDGLADPLLLLLTPLPLPPLELPSVRPLSVQMPLMQVPVQQSLSPEQGEPAPASALSGMQLRQSGERSQPAGQVAWQLVGDGLQPIARPRVVAAATARHRNPIVASPIRPDIGSPIGFECKREKEKDDDSMSSRVGFCLHGSFSGTPCRGRR